MADCKEMKEKMKDAFEKACDKAKEIKESEETQKFIDNTKKTAAVVGKKTKDVAIEVGVKVADAAEILATKTSKALHEAKKKNDAKRAAEEQKKAEQPDTDECVDCIETTCTEKPCEQQEDDIIESSNTIDEQQE